MKSAIRLLQTLPIIRIKCMESIDIIYNVYQRTVGNYKFSIRSYYSRHVDLGIGFFVNDLPLPIFYYEAEKTNSIPVLEFNHALIQSFMDSDNYENKNVTARFISFKSLIKMFEFYAHSHFAETPNESLLENQTYRDYMNQLTQKIRGLK